MLILINGKNLKTLTKDLRWEGVTSRFPNFWTDTVAEAYITPEFYFDVGKEVCPVQKSRVACTWVEDKSDEEGIRLEGKAPAKTRRRGVAWRLLATRFKIDAARQQMAIK